MPSASESILTESYYDKVRWRSSNIVGNGGQIFNRRKKKLLFRPFLFFFFSLAVFVPSVLLFLAAPTAGLSSATVRNGSTMPDHIHIALIINNSTMTSSYAARQTAYIESAARLYSFMDKSLILDQTRLIVTIIRVPARDLLSSIRILCKELHSTSNLVALVVGDVSSSLMSYIVGLANDAQIPLIDLIRDAGRYTSVFSTRPEMASQHVSVFDPGFVVYLRPSAALHTATAIGDLLSVYKWERMLLLYDRPQSLTEMQKLLGDVGVEGVPAEKAVFRLNNSNLFEVTQSIKYRWQTVVVALDEAMTYKFLRVALRTGILSSGYSFILTNPNAHYISYEDFAQNFPNVTVLRFLNGNKVTRSVLENARRFEQMQNRYHVVVPERVMPDEIPQILTYNRELPISLDAALVLDALTLIRRAMASLFSPSPWSLDSQDTSKMGGFDFFTFQPTKGLACRPYLVRSSVPAKSPYGRAILQAIRNVEFEGMTGPVMFSDNMNFRHVSYVEILGLGGIGMLKIGKWLSDAAVLREAAMLRLKEQMQQQAILGTSLSLSASPPPMPSKILAPNELRLSLDSESIDLIKRATVLTNRTLVLTTIKKKTLIVTTIAAPPYVMKRKDKSKISPKSRSAVEHDFEGFCIELLDEIAGMTGFTYRIHLVADNKYGNFDRDTGKWNGMVGEVIDGKADIAIAPLTITYAREQVVDFTKPFMNLGISILYLQPFKEKPSIFSFMQPLAGEIWGYVSLSYIVVTFFFYAVGRFSPYEWHEVPGIDGSTDGTEEQVDTTPRHPLAIDNHVNIFTAGNSSWFTAGTLMQQGSDVSPRALSTRIVGGAWWFFSLIIISSYTANLAAFLTVENVFSPFENAEELASQDKVVYGAVTGGSTQNFFRESRIPTYRTMWTKMADKDVFVSSNTEGIKRVREAAGGYAYLMESVTLEYIVQSPTHNKDCNLRQVGGLLDSKGYGIATARDSPYRDVLSMAILQLQENDHLALLYNKWWQKGGNCMGQQENRPKVLGVQNIGGIFAILLGGLAVSLVSVIFEIFWYAHKHQPGDTRPYWRRLYDSLKMLSYCKSTHSGPIIAGPTVEGIKRSSSVPAISSIAGDSPPINLANFRIRRRSKSFHETSTDNDSLPSPLPMMKSVNKQHMFRAYPDDTTEVSQKLLLSGGVISNLTPKSRANAIALLEKLSKQQNKSPLDVTPVTPSQRPSASRTNPNRRRNQHRHAPSPPQAEMTSFNSPSSIIFNLNSREDAV